MAIATYTKTGTKAATPAKLPAKVFGLKVESKQLLKDAYLAYLANGRANLAVTKTRGEVSGGGRKPWRQKGTGRARVGSSRNPIWTGGGVAFGPTGNENYSRRLNIKARRLALRQALSLAAAEGRIKIIDSFSIASGKTKDALGLLKKLDASGNIIITTEKVDEKTGQALRNASKIKLIGASSLNVYDVLNCDVLIIEKEALASLDKRLAAEVKAPKAKEVKDE